MKAILIVLIAEMGVCAFSGGQAVLRFRLGPRRDRRGEVAGHHHGRGTEQVRGNSLKFEPIFFHFMVCYCQVLRVGAVAKLSKVLL